MPSELEKTPISVYEDWGFRQPYIHKTMDDFFNHPSNMPGQYDAVAAKLKKYIDNFTSNFRIGKCIFLTGSACSGKTALSQILGMTLTKRGWDAIYLNMDQVMHKLLVEKSTHSKDAYISIIKQQIVVLDDCFKFHTHLNVNPIHAMRDVFEIRKGGRYVTIFCSGKSIEEIYEEDQDFAKLVLTQMCVVQLPERTIEQANNGENFW